MPVTPSYPGIYIEELPSTSHTITAAPTSIAVFVGYTHPFKTANFGKAVQLFSFTDYEREFGGPFSGNLLDHNVPLAVREFFLNGGSEAYVVGIQAKNYFDNTSPTPADVGDVLAATLTRDGVHYRSIELTDDIPGPSGPVSVSPQISIANVASAGKVADITLTYGSRPPEVYRGVSTDAQISGHDNPDFVKTRLAGSSYIVVDTVDAGATFTATTAGPLTLAQTIPATAVSTFEASAFNAVFATDGDLDKVPIFNLLVLPGITHPSVLSTALAFAEHKQAFVIIDPSANATASPSATAPKTYVGTDFDSVPKSPNGAFYFPYLKTSDPIGGSAIALPPSGYVAGIFARTDTNRGVWKAPAGLETTVLDTTGVIDDGRMTDLRQGQLNLAGVNCLRTFPGIGTVNFGARTLVSANPAYEQWRYVPVRRTALFIEQTLYRNLGWAVFEPNDNPLWVALTTSVEQFMLALFNRGAFQGSKPSDAFLVRCDASTTTQTDINNGVVNIIVGFAPLKPAEFVIVKIAQLAGQAQS